MKGRVDRPTVEGLARALAGAYTAHETRRLARKIGLAPCTTPIGSPQSNGMAEAFVKTPNHSSDQPFFPSQF